MAVDVFLWEPADTAQDLQELRGTDKTRKEQPKFVDPRREAFGMRPVAAPPGLFPSAR